MRTGMSTAFPTTGVSEGKALSDHRSTVTGPLLVPMMSEMTKRLLNLSAFDRTLFSAFECYTTRRRRSLTLTLSLVFSRAPMYGVYPE
jgi:hypothetical protein